MANATFLAVGFFSASKVGKTGLADVTVDVAEFDIAALTCNNTFLVAQPATETIDGHYHYYFTGDEDRLYLVVFKTADLTVDSKFASAIGALVGRLGSLDADISSRAVPGDCLTAQAARDALKLAPTAGDPAAGSIDAHLDAAALEATLMAIKGAGWSTETLAAIDALIDGIKAKSDLIPASPAAVGSAMTLTAAYDLAKTAAQAGDIPTSQEIRDAMKLAPTAGDPAAGSVDDHLDDIDGALTGEGLIEKTYTLTDAITGLPLVGVQVWATTDLAGLHQVDLMRTTDDAGQVVFRFNLEAGTTVYVWNRYMASGDAPDTEVI